MGFCGGNSGDPIFSETFGTGTSNTPLPAGTTTYTFASFDPQDGFYTVSSNTGYFDWHNTTDHTVGDSNGKSLIVNADFTAGEFYRTTINGLCENTSYEFSSWLLNLLPPDGCGGNGIPINVRFEIWDITDTNLLASGDTGNVSGSTSPNWQQYGLVFQTEPVQTAVILKMINNGIGGCGNDLAIDDIVFKTCGDFISIIDTSNNNGVTICSSQTPYTTSITAIPDNTVFNSHFYQWQESTDTSSWVDIIGEINAEITISGITTTMYYRAKVAESASNLNNEDCITFSNVFPVTVIQAPNEPLVECWETATLNDTTCSWEITGTQPEEPTDLECWETTSFNNTTCNWDITGTQPAEPTNLECWESTNFNNQSCSWEITGTQPIDLIEEFLIFCEGEEITLQASNDITDPTHNWNTGETTEFITVNTPGTYIVETTDGCLTIVKTIYLEQQETPVIESVQSDGNDLIVYTANTGDFLYSLDGINFQSSHIFLNIDGGKYTVYIKAFNCDAVVTVEHLHFYIPKFFTPNGDTYNDTFDLKGIECFDSSEVFIFDRYGKLLISTRNRDIAWDGTFINEALPTSDYWYFIRIDGQEFRGHFTLKR